MKLGGQKDLWCAGIYHSRNKYFFKYSLYQMTFNYVIRSTGAPRA